MRRFLQMAAALVLPAAATAQSAEQPPVLSQAEEIALARSAAPAGVSGDATILVLKDGKYVTVQEGSNGVTCIVSRSFPLSIEPICYDPEASRTILPIEIRRVEMRLAGVPADEIERRIDEGLGSGEFAVPQRPAMAYMMSAGQILYSDAETRVGSYYPHLHLFIPYATGAQFGGLSGSSSQGGAFMFDEGKPTANLVVLVREFVEPVAADGSTR